MIDVRCQDDNMTIIGVKRLIIASVILSQNKIRETV